MILQSLYFLTGFFCLKNLRTVYSLEQKMKYELDKTSGNARRVAWCLNVHKARSV